MTDTQQQHRERQQREVDDNHAAFLEMERGLIVDHNGRFALLKDRKVVAIFDTYVDARTVGDMLYDDRVFSIQEIGARPINLGFHSAF